MFGDTEYAGDTSTQGVGRLRRGPNGQLAMSTIDSGCRRSGFQECSVDTLVHESELDDRVRAAKGSVNITETEIPTKCLVIRPIGMKSRRIGSEGSFRVDDRREFPVLDEYFGRRVFSCGTTRREDGDHTLTDETNAIDRQRVTTLRTHAGRLRRNGEGREPVREIATAQRCHEPRHSCRGAPVHVRDLSVWIGTPYECEVECSGQRDVVGKDRPTSQIPLILESANRASEVTRFAHVVPLSNRRARFSACTDERERVSFGIRERSQDSERCRSQSRKISASCGKASGGNASSGNHSTAVLSSLDLSSPLTTRPSYTARTTGWPCRE